MDNDKLQMSTTTDGKPPRPGFEKAGAPAPIDPRTGQHESYWVLSEEERKKGFVRPVRQKYIHLKCGGETHMGLALSETYARDPKYYGATMCVQCGSHFRLQDTVDGEYRWMFEWSRDGEPVGSTEEEAKAYMDVKEQIEKDRLELLEKRLL